MANCDEIAKKLKSLFLKYLTEDSRTKDRRRKEFNQAIFNREEGWSIWTETDLGMVMDKFDLAVEEFKKLKNEH